MKINAYWNKNLYAVELDINKVHNALYQAKLTFPDGKIVEGVGSDYFDAILQTRAIIEPHGWLLGINASRLDAGSLLDRKNPNEALVSLIINKEIRNVHALDAAELEQLGTIEYQNKFFQERYSEVVKMDESKKFLVRENRQIRKDDPNQYVTYLGPLLVLLSSVYPLTLLVINFPSIGYFFLWLGLDVLIYAAVIVINIEVVVLTRRASLGLVFAIALPILATIGMGAYEFYHYASLISKSIPGLS